LAAFDALKREFDDIGASILAASVDTLEHAAEVQGELSFPIAFGVTREQAGRIGSWWEERRSIIQPSEFILSRDGTVVSATYSTGPVGRLMPEDALKLIRFVEAQKSKQSS
jgi:peroxiredoxin